MDQLDLFADADEIPATFTARPAAAPRPAAVPAPRPAPAPRPVVAAAEPDSLFADPRPELPAVQTPIPARRGVTPLLIGNPRDAGQRLGEAVAETWHASNWGGYRMDIPVSIVAALALFPIKGHTEDVARIISTCSDCELLQGYREIYAATWTSRPDLGARMAPLMSWLTEDGVEEKAYAVRRVTDTALRYGVLQMTGSPDPDTRSDTDLMSWTITSLRSHGARQGLGEYHTPPELCDLMARMTCDVESLQKGAWFHEPAAWDRRHVPRAGAAPAQPSPGPRRLQVGDQRPRPARSGRCGSQRDRVGVGPERRRLLRRRSAAGRRGGPGDAGACGAHRGAEPDRRVRRGGRGVRRGDQARRPAPDRSEGHLTWGFAEKFLTPSAILVE